MIFLLCVLTNQNIDIEIPLILTKKEVETKYLKERITTKINKIHKKTQVGIINGLWANSMGLGGIITIECKWFPTNTFLDFKLTGMQGDVMKESMNVAKTLAWKLTDNKLKTKLLKTFEKTKLQGIHIN